MDSKPICARCGGEMKPGKALLNTLAGYPDFPGDTGRESGSTMSYTGPPALVDCLKCLDCGRSVIP